MFYDASMQGVTHDTSATTQHSCAQEAYCNPDAATAPWSPSEASQAPLLESVSDDMDLSDSKLQRIRLWTHRRLSLIHI